MLTIALAKLGIIDNYIEYSFTRTREYLGFRYCLIPSNILFNVIALSFYTKSKSITWIEIIFYICFTFYLYQKTVARLTCICCLLILIWIIFEKIGLNLELFFSKRKYILYTMSSAFFVLSILSLYVVFHYDSSVSWMIELNKFLEGRITMAATSINRFGIESFGSHPEWVGNGLSANGEQVFGCIYM